MADVLRENFSHKLNSLKSFSSSLTCFVKKFSRMPRKVDFYKSHSVWGKNEFIVDVKSFRETFKNYAT